MWTILQDSRKYYRRPSSTLTAFVTFIDGVYGAYVCGIGVFVLSEL